MHFPRAGSVGSMAGENIKPTYGGDKETFLTKVVSPIYVGDSMKATWISKVGKFEHFQSGNMTIYDGKPAYKLSVVFLTASMLKHSQAVLDIVAKILDYWTVAVKMLTML